MAWIICSAALYAGDDAKPRPKLTDAVQAIVDMTRAAAPEIYADTIVKLVESGKIPQRELQVELLEDAFHAAERAAEGVRLIAIPGTPPDTREMWRGKAGALGLDAISLQARILRSLLTMDRAKARALFDQIKRPALDPRPCEDALVADIAPYYEIAAAVAQSTFDETAKSRGVHLQFLTGLLTTAKSPGELAAFAKSVDSVTFTQEQWGVMFAVIGRKLESIGPDYRSFAVSFNAMQAAVVKLDALGHVGLIESFRKYIIAQMSAARCQPDIPLETDAYLGQEAMPKVEKKGGVQAHAYFESAEGKSIGEHLGRLTGNISDDEFTDLLNEFKSWTPSGSDIEVLQQKATVLKALLEKRITVSQQDRVVTLAVELLSMSESQRSNAAEWWWQVRAFASAIRALGETGRAPRLLLYLAR